MQEPLTYPIWTQFDAFWAAPGMIGAALAPDVVVEPTQT